MSTMSAVDGCPGDLKLVLHDNLSDSYELSQVLLASACFDGKLQLLTSGWERALGYGRKEFQQKTLLELMGCDVRRAAAAVKAILDVLSSAPVDLSMRSRSGRSLRFRLHRHYDRQEHVMYIVAEAVA